MGKYKDKIMKAGAQFDKGAMDGLIQMILGLTGGQNILRQVSPMDAAGFGQQVGNLGQAGADIIQEEFKAPQVQGPENRPFWERTEESLIQQLSKQGQGITPSPKTAGSTPQGTPQDKPSKSTPKEPEYMKGRTKAGEINGKPVPEARVDQVLNARYQVQKANAMHQQKLADLEMMRTQRAMQQDMIQETQRQETELKMAEARQESAEVMELIRQQGAMNQAQNAAPYMQAQQEAARQEAIVADMASKQDQLSGLMAQAQSVPAGVQEARIKAQGDVLVAQEKAKSDEKVARINNNRLSAKYTADQKEKFNKDISGIVSKAQGIKIPVMEMGTSTNVDAGVLAADTSRPFDVRYRGMSTMADSIAKVYTPENKKVFSTAVSELTEAIKLATQDPRAQGANMRELIGNLVDGIGDYDLSDRDAAVLENILQSYNYDAEIRYGIQGQSK